ncbi:uncharacterized protein [Amphiura filiformis]|uniref:uncharacterized protein n=1 Tax=Amphiura filiformis TaxID=82378 RepID=UPI003B211643
MAPQRKAREWDYLDPQVCKYCRRVFYNKQSRYLRHLRHHELSIRPYWYDFKRVRTLKQRRKKCDKSGSKIDTSVQGAAVSAILHRNKTSESSRFGKVPAPSSSSSPTHKEDTHVLLPWVPTGTSSSQRDKEIHVCSKSTTIGRVQIEKAATSASVKSKSINCDTTATVMKNLSNFDKKFGHAPPSINTRTSLHDEVQQESGPLPASSPLTIRDKVQGKYIMSTSRSSESTHLERVQKRFLSASAASQSANCDKVQTTHKSPLSVKSCDKKVQIGLVSPLIKSNHSHCEEVKAGHFSLSTLTVHESVHGEDALSSQVEGAQKEHVAALVTRKSTNCDKVQTARVSPAIRSKSKHCDKKVQDSRMSPSVESKSSHCAKVQPKHVTFFEDLWGDKLPIGIVSAASKKKATNSNKKIQVAHVSPSLKSKFSSCKKVQSSHVSSPVSNHSIHRKKVEAGHVSSSASRIISSDKKARKDHHRCQASRNVVTKCMQDMCRHHCQIRRHRLPESRKDIKKLL